MSQTIFTTINPATTSGNQLATILNNFKDAYVSGNSGTSRPAALAEGGVWVDMTADPTSWTLKMYDGTTDISLFVIDLSLGVASVTTNSSLLTILKSSDDAVGAILKFFKERATGDQTLASDVIGEIDFYGNRDTDVETLQARIKATSSNNVTSLTQGAYITFEGTTLGAASVAEWMRLVDAKLGIGTTAPDETLHVKGSGFKVEKNSDDAVGSKLIFKKKRITGVGQVQSSDVISSQSYNSTDDTGLNIEVSTVEVTATELHTSTAQGTSWKLKTKNNGSASLTTKITVDNSGVDIPELKVGTVSNTEIGYLDGVTSSIQTQIGSKISSTEKGAANGVAPLDSGSKIDAAYLPSYVDDVLEYVNLAGFPATGATGIIYVALDTNKTYRWTGSVYVEISSSLSDTLLTSTAFTLSTARHFAANAATDSTVTGADATLTAFTAGVIRLTNASLTSYSNIPAGTDGQLLLVTNRVGTDVTVKDQSDALGTASGRIYTGEGASVTQKNNATFSYVYDSTSSRWNLVGGTGSGSGQGGINYILNYSAEAGTTGWATYADAAGVAPVDGTGGSATTTFTRTTSSPLRGVASFLITKDAANRQGEGASYAFTIDAADKGKVLQGSFDYQIASGTYADNDISLWVYDVTNSVMIQPTPYLLKNTTINDKMFFEFQTASNSTSYRLIAHVASTSASAYTVKIDNLSVGPQAKLYGSTITDWITYTPTFVSFGTATNIDFRYRRVGSNLEVIGRFTTGTVAGTVASVSFPTGMAAISTLSGLVVVGSSFTSFTAATNTNSQSVIVTANDTSFGFNDTGTTNLQTGTASAITGNSKAFSFQACVPIQGWSSSQVISSDADTRVVAAIVTGDPASATVGNPIIVPTVGYDSHGAYNATTGRYTCPVPGIYKFYGALTSASSATTLTIYKNAVSNILAGNLDSNGEATFAASVNCIAGDILDIRPGATVDATSMAINIERTCGPSQVMASETVTASYYVSTNFAASTTVPINFDTKEFDSHSAVTPSATVWKFVAPISGLYSVEFYGQPSGSSSIICYKNGTIYKFFGSGGSSFGFSGVMSVKLLAGEYVDFRPDGSITFTGGVQSGASAKITVTRAGSY